MIPDTQTVLHLAELNYLDYGLNNCMLDGSFIFRANVFKL